MYNRYILIFFSILITSCSINQELTQYGYNEKYFSSLNIIEGQTSERLIIKKLGPPSFKNPYDNKNVFYVSQKMIKVVGKVNQFDNLSILEIIYDNNRVVKNYMIKKNKGNNFELSKLKDNSFTENRKVFEVFKNIFSNLRRRN